MQLMMRGEKINKNGRRRMLVNESWPATYLSRKPLYSRGFWPIARDGRVWCQAGRREQWRKRTRNRLSEGKREQHPAYNGSFVLKSGSEEERRKRHNDKQSAQSYKATTKQKIALN